MKSAWAKAHREDARAHYHAVPFEERRKKNAAHYRENAERLKAYQRERNKTHKYARGAASLERARAYDQTPARREAARLWRSAHPVRMREHAQKRRVLHEDAFVEEIDMAALHARDKGRCWLCRRPVALIAASLDHVIPISKGGKHEYANAHIAHRRCNSRKHAKVLTLF